MLIVDTDVLIWYLRGNEKAFKTIENFESFSLSVVTYMELVQGMRNKNELNSLRQALHAWNATILYITEEISAKAMFAVVKKDFLLLREKLQNVTLIKESLNNIIANNFELFDKVIDIKGCIPC